MHLKKIIISSLFFLSWHTALSMMEADSLEDTRSTCAEKLCHKFRTQLNTQAGETIYSDLFFSEPLSGGHTPSPISQSVFYSVEMLRQNGVPFIKMTDDSGIVSWRHPKREECVIIEDSILENFRGLDFLEPRKKPLSQTHYSLLESNPNFTVEKQEDSFFYHTPFLMTVKSNPSSSKTVSAYQKGCFLRGHAPSLGAYEDASRYPQNRFSFRTIVSSEEFNGSIELDIVGAFNPHVGYKVSLETPDPHNEDFFAPNTLYLKPERKTLAYVLKGPKGEEIRGHIDKKDLPFDFNPKSSKDHFEAHLSEILKITSKRKQTHHMVFSPLRSIYAFNMITNQIDVFMLTSLPFPFEERFIKIEASPFLKR